MIIGLLGFFASAPAPATKQDQTGPSQDGENSTLMSGLKGNEKTKL
jgi:hypothetical protein